MEQPEYNMFARQKMEEDFFHFLKIKDLVPLFGVHYLSGLLTENIWMECQMTHELVWTLQVY